MRNTEPQFSEPYVASNFLTLHGFRGSEEAQLEEVPALPERRIETWHPFMRGPFNGGSIFYLVYKKGFRV